MTLEPLLAASPAIILHAGLALAAFGLGLVQILAPKGTLPHRLLGWIWVAIMTLVAVSSFFIRSLTPGQYSFIHLISIATLILLPLAVHRARQHDVRRHRRAMLGLYLGALVIAGSLTLLPGRIMFKVVFGD